MAAIPTKTSVLPAVRNHVVAYMNDTSPASGGAIEPETMRVAIVPTAAATSASTISIARCPNKSAVSVRARNSTLTVPPIRPTTEEAATPTTSNTPMVSQARTRKSRALKTRPMNSRSSPGTNTCVVMLTIGGERVPKYESTTAADSATSVASESLSDTRSRHETSGSLTPCMVRIVPGLGPRRRR